MATHIQTRGDTAAHWTTYNPVLLAREQGIETDTRKVKYGDGVTAWNSLPYAATTSGVASVNGETGTVILSPADVDAVEVAGTITKIAGPMTAAAYAAIGTPDPNTLFVIVG